MRARVPVTFTLPGEPCTKGSHSIGYRRDGRAFVRNANAREKTWATSIAWAALAARGPSPLLEGAVRLDVMVSMANPLRPPDGDKVLRSIADALSGVLYRDDRQIINWHLQKRAGDPGVTVTVEAETDAA